MIFKDYYKILGLDSSKVSTTDIKTAYKEQAKKYHPDVNGGNKRFEERFKDINEAYNVLSNYASKRKYDRTWNSHVGKKQRNSAYQAKDGKEVIWKVFFGNALEDKTKPEIGNAIRGEDIETQINISLEDAFRGNEKSIALKDIRGKITTLKVNIPAGIQSGEKIRLIGQGKKGINGGKNGDLFIKINIEDNDKFILEGSNLRTNLYLTPWEAALSSKVMVQNIDEELYVYVPAGIQSGEEIRIENKGYRNNKGERGDLILETKIMIPTKMSKEELELFKKLKEESRFNPRNIA